MPSGGTRNFLFNTKNSVKFRGIPVPFRLRNFVYTSWSYPASLPGVKKNKLVEKNLLPGKKKPELRVEVSTSQRLLFHNDVHHRGLICPWTTLDNRDLSCTLTCLHNRSLCCSWTCLLSTLKGPELHLDVCRLQEPVLPLDLSTLQRSELHLDVSTKNRGLCCTWTFLDNRSLC